jgi:broad specificity phosphatase PhoE
VELILIRHGETEWTINGRHTGTTDLELTAHGREEAATLAALVERTIDSGGDEAVVCSPRIRAQQTAQIGLPGRATTIDDRLAEFDYGDFEGLTKAEILVRKPGWEIWFDGCPNGETVADVGRRVDDFLRAHAGHDRLISVAHGHLSRILAARALGLAPEMGRLFSIDTASLSIIRGVGGAPVIVKWNLVG